MTNEEPTKNYIDILEVYKLNYNKTKWGRIYGDYKQMSQIQLQKALEGNGNELKRYVGLNPYQKTKVNQHVFYETEWSEVEQKYVTPAILLKLDKELREFQEVHKKVFASYIKRCTAQHEEVTAYYEARKVELQWTQSSAHKEHAKEKVTCQHCKASFSRTNLARHQKTNQKCLKAKMTNEEVL